MGVFFIEDDELLGTYINIWNKSSSSIKKNLIANPSTIKKNLKTKIRSYGNEATDFHDKELPDTSSNCTCLAVI